MYEFPPRSEDQVTLTNWRTSPFNRWSFQHVREIVPSADIANDPDNVRALEVALANLAELGVEGESGAVSLNACLEQTQTDGFIMLHRGQIVAEYYANGMTAATPHILMSVSKSMLGLLAGILIDQGVLDEHALASDYLPELSGTAYVGATIRHLLDMRVGIKFNEDYLITRGPIIDYRKATNWNPIEPGDAPSDLRSFYAKLTETDGPHNGRFHYVSPNTDLLAWIMERAAGKRYADLMSELLWQPMGAQNSSYITVDRLGAPRAAGGMCVTTRDLARVGQVLVDGGRRDGTQIVPQGWIDDLSAAGDSEAWQAGDFTKYFPGLAIRYRSKWYTLDGEAPMLFCLGIHGQYLFVDCVNQVVIAKLSSRATPIDDGEEQRTIRMAQALRDFIA
jgi:hypothetical protein